MTVSKPKCPSVPSIRVLHYLGLVQTLPLFIWRASSSSDLAQQSSLLQPPGFPSLSVGPGGKRGTQTTQARREKQRKPSSEKR